MKIAVVFDFFQFINIYFYDHLYAGSINRCTKLHIHLEEMMDFLEFKVDGKFTTRLYN